MLNILGSREIGRSFPTVSPSRLSEVRIMLRDGRARIATNATAAAVVVAAAAALAL